MVVSSGTLTYRGSISGISTEVNGSEYNLRVDTNLSVGGGSPQKGKNCAVIKKMN